jgi:hypothetical protein
MTKVLIESIVELIKKSKVNLVVKYEPRTRGKDSVVVYRALRKKKVIIGKEEKFVVTKFFLTCGEMGSVYHFLVGYYNGVKYHDEKLY